MQANPKLDSVGHEAKTKEIDRWCHENGRGTGWGEEGHEEMGEDKGAESEQNASGSDTHQGLDLVKSGGERSCLHVKEKLWKKPNLLAQLAKASGPQNCEIMGFYLLGLLVCGVLLQRPW